MEIQTCSFSSPDQDLSKNTLNRRKTTGFTLVEVMLVVALIAMLAAIATPNFIRARRRAQANIVVDEMRALESAISLYAVENGKRGAHPISSADIATFLPFIKTNSQLYNTLPNDLLGNPIGLSTLDTPPKISPATFSALSDSVPSDFWSPYYP